MKRKGKRFNAVIALVLAATMLFGTVSASAEPLSEMVENVETQAATAETETFIYPEKKETEDSPEEQVEGDLRLPETSDTSNEDDERYGEPVVISEHSKIYQTGDQTFKTIYSEIPNTFEDTWGNQKEYDNTLTLKEKLLTADYYTNKQSDIEVKLPAAIENGDGVTFEHDGVKVDLIPIEGDYSRSAVKDNAILYNDVYEGIDVQYTVHELGLKEDIIFNQWTDKNTFTYTLDTHGAEARLENGVINLYEKDERVLTLAAPMMTDHDANICENVTLSLSEEKGEYTVTVTVDKNWLDAPERAYPVKIDPNLTVPTSKFTVVTASEYRGVYQGRSYGYAGHLTDDQIGTPGAGDLGKTRMYFHIDDDLSEIPEGAKINSAALRIYQYMDYNGGKTQFQCFRIEDNWSPSTLDWDSAVHLNQSPCGESSIVTSGVGFHSFDCRETVNNWVQGIQENHGFVVQATDENKTGSPFFTPLSAATNPGQEAFTPDKAPQLIVDWELPNPVDPNYPLDDTTVELRTIIETDKSGKLHFYAVFADGVAQPGSIVVYQLNDTNKSDQVGLVPGDYSYKYPDSTAWDSYFPDRATKYKDIQSNWQTLVPFTDPDFNTEYYYDVIAVSSDIGKTVRSDSFLIYEVQQFDTLPKIANYYGVPLDQISFDNRVQDMLLIEGNTLFIRNPQKNANKPYNPGDLSVADKKAIDSLLMGRGRHCEFGFEPVNINTGNFYFDAEDVAIPDYNGDFSINRTYNSKGAGYNSIFGRGWQFEYSESISKTAEGEYIYSRGDGSAIYFTPDGKGGYTCPEGYHFTFTPVKIGEKEADFGTGVLEKYDVYEYEIRSVGGEVRRFNTFGLLSKITDDKGFVTTLGYDDNYNLKTITSPGGTVYTLSYTVDGYVSDITLPSGKRMTYEYDDNNNLVSFTDASGCETRYAYNDAHQMTFWKDGAGNVVVTNTYDEHGRVTKQVDANNQAVKFEYADGKTTTTDAEGNKTVYYYDGQYRTTKIEYPNGSTEQKSYDSQNNLAYVIDRNGNKTEYTYDANGNVLTEKRFDGAVRSYTYNGDNQVTKIVDFDGKITTYTYSNKDVVKQTNPDGTALEFEYDGHHRLTKSTDAMGYTTTYSYSGIWATGITAPDGTVTQYAYDSMGNVVSITDAEGGITRYTYDAAGRQLTEQKPAGGVTTYTYDSAGNAQTVTDPNGNVFRFACDGLGNVIGAIDPYWHLILYTYDGMGNKLTETDPNGNVTTYAYDNMYNLSSVTDGEGYTVSYAYDNMGNQLAVTDARGNTTAVTYDYRFNKVSKQTDALGNVTQYTYDAVGNLIQTRYPNGGVVTNEYDEMNRLVSTTSLTGVVTAYTYDNNGNVLTILDSTGRMVVNTYDKMNRLVKTVRPDGAEIEYAYDGLGQLREETDAMGGKTVYTYDADGNIISVKDPLGRETTYEYDLNGNLIVERAPNGAITGYEYNANNLATLMVDEYSNLTAYTYDGNENLLTVTDAYDVPTTYTYDARNLPVSVKDAYENTQSMIYDENGNLVAVIDADEQESGYYYDELNRVAETYSAGGYRVNYTYDSMGQLIQSQDNTGGSMTYTYDVAGRLLKTEDALGQTTEYTYDGRDNITAVKNTDGTTTYYTYDIMGNVLTAKDPEGKVTTYTYDANGNLLTQEDDAHRVWSYTYDAVGRLTEEINPLAESTRYTYNELDQLTGMTNAAGGQRTYTYDPLGNMLTETDENGNTTTYEYDALSRLTSTTAADGGKQQFYYDALSQLYQSKDALGNVTKYDYDDVGNLVKLTTPSGGEYTYEYNEDHYQIGETDPLGNKTTSTYDPAGRLTGKTLANGAQYTYTYDAIGRLTKQTAPEGLSNTYVYDAAGNLKSETDQSGRTTSYTYDIMHRLTGTTDPSGATTSMAYDSRGNLSRVTSALGYTTQYEYDPLDRIIKTLDPVGRTEEYTYDPLGNITQVTKTGGRVYTYTYDAAGNQLSVKDPLGQTASYSYDSMNRLTGTTDRLGNETAYAYDLNGNVTAFTSANGGVEKYTYDGNGNLSSVTDGEGRETEYYYDQADQLLLVMQGGMPTALYAYNGVGDLSAVVDGNGQITSYTYDQLGNLTSVQDPLGNVKQFTYNVNAQLETVTNPDGTTVDYDYDVLDQLIAKSYDGEDIQGMYGYDADGNRVSMEDVAGFTGYEYDAAGRITAVNLSTGYQIKYAYDPYGNLSELTYPDGTKVTYTYDALDRLTAITDRDGETTTYTYNANDQVTRVDRPNKTYTNIEYDELGNVVRVENMRSDLDGAVETKNAIFAYTYDASGFITGELAIQGVTVIEREFEYDELGQIVTVHERTDLNGVGTWEESTTKYEYDAAGNRIREEYYHGPVMMNYTDHTYNEGNQLVDSVKTIDLVKQSTHYTYDVNGNLTQEKESSKVNPRNYTYDHENRLQAVKAGDRLLMAALYDGNGDRIFTVNAYNSDAYVTNGHGTASDVYTDVEFEDSYEYDREMVIDALLMPNGVTLGEAGMYELTGYINNINAEQTQVLMEFGSNGHFSNVYDYGVWRNSVDVKSARKTYYMYDGRGSVSGLTGQEGYDVVTYRYDIYGEETQSAATYNPYRYNAEYTDMATGLQYLRSRYYSPAITRFLSKDPVLGVTTLPYTFNPYLYCLNNAVNYFDPNGMFFKEVFGAVAGAAKGVWNAGKAMFDSDVTVAEGWNSGWQSGKAAGNWRGGLWDNSVSNAWDKAEHRIQTIMNYDNQVRQSRALDPNGEAPYYGTEASWFDGISYKIRDNAMGVYSNKQEIEELDIEYENLEWQLQKASTERDRTTLKEQQRKIEERRKALCEEINTGYAYITSGVFDALGMIPGVGAVFDVGNLVIYATQGDWANFVITAVFLGINVGVTAKLGKALDAGSGLTTTSKNVFPTSPSDFNPDGLIPKTYNTKNGKIIKWFNSKGKAIFEWDEDLTYGSHYHVISEDGNTRVPNSSGETHFNPGDEIPF
ncbi:MAG: DNRLRE domain-containing protein [Clostridia bacterium]